MANDSLTYQPTCEDYDSDESDGHIPDSFRRPPAPHAPVAAPSPPPADLGADKALSQQRAPVHLDLQSDSGYSSHTAATMSSADSAPSYNTMRPPMPVPMPPPAVAPFPSQSPAQRNGQPAMGDARQASSQSVPRAKQVPRRESQSTKRPAAPRRLTITTQELPRESRDDGDGGDECRDPDCTTCGPNAPVQRRGPEPAPSDSGLDGMYPYDQRSQRSDAGSSYASSYASPPSPTYSRQPQYAQGAVVAQPGQTRRRPSTAGRQRPVTYHADGPTYWPQGMPAPYPSPPQEHGPPPSISAYHSMQQYTPMPSYMPSPSQTNGFYTAGQPVHQTSPPYDLQRPALPVRAASSYTRSNYPPPVVTHDRSERTMYSARYGQPPSAAQAMYTQPSLPLDEGSSDSESDSGSEADYIPDSRTLMHPPRITSSSKLRPSLRKAKTTQVIDHIDRPTARDRDRDRDRPSRTNTPSTRGVSVTRPTHRQTQSYDTPRARVIVENSKGNRRQLYQGHDKLHESQYIVEQKRQNRNSKGYREERHEPTEYGVEQKRRNRSSKSYPEDQYESDEDKTEQKRRNRTSRIYQQEHYASDDHDEEDDMDGRAIVPLSTRRRRDTDADTRRGKDRIVDPRNKSTEMAAEEYMKAIRGGRDPQADQIHKAAKRASRAASRPPSRPSSRPPSGRPSESDSSHSKGSDKDSQSNRTPVTSGGPNDVIRLRVDASAPLSLSFNGDMEGRTLQFTPAENGMADIVIGGARGNEVAYRGEKGSDKASNRKALIANQARRDAEETSERSSRSARSRREGRESREIRDTWEDQRRILGRRREVNYH